MQLHGNTTYDNHIQISKLILNDCSGTCIFVELGYM